MRGTQLIRAMTMGSLIFACASGVGIVLSTIALFISGWAAVMPLVISILGVLVFGVLTFVLADQDSDSELNRNVEREILTRKQRDELRRVRGEVLLRKALIEVQEEDDKLTRRQLEAPDPPGRDY